METLEHTAISHIPLMISYVFLVGFSYAVQVFTSKALVKKTEEIQADQKEMRVEQKETRGVINDIKIEQAKTSTNVSNIARELNSAVHRLSIIEKESRNK